MQRIWLKERRAVRCQLSPVDVEFLVAHHGHHLQILPTDSSSLYQVRCSHLVGVIQAPNCQIVIEPKLPLSSLCYLLGLEKRVSLDAGGFAEVGSALLSSITARLLDLLHQRTRRGLRHDYVQKPHQGPWLQGALDVPEQQRRLPRRDQLYSRFDDWSHDVPCNQIIQASLIRLLGCMEVLAFQPAIRQQLSQFNNVSPVNFHRAQLRQLRLAQHDREYAEILDLCSMILEGLSPALSDAAEGGASFLLNLQQIFERHVERGLTLEMSRLGEQSLVSQMTVHAALDDNQRPALPVRPDLCLHRAGQPYLILDTKWKALPRQGPRPADLYQLLSYCAALGCRQGMLIYPGRSRHTQRYQLTRAKLELSFQTVRVHGTPEQCQRSLRRLARILHFHGRD